MKTGIWGAGNIAYTHGEALKASGIAIGAVVDVNQGKAQYTFRSLINHYYADVKKGKAVYPAIYPTFEEGMNIVKLCNAMLKSGESEGRWVTLP